MLTKLWNQKTIRIRENDRYVCLTDIAKATGKFLADWNRLNGTTEYLQALERAMRIPIAELIDIKRGGLPQDQGTFANPKIALRFAQWCSAELAVQVDFWIDELLTTGKVELKPKQTELPQTYLDALKALVASEEQKLALQAQIEQDAPLVEYAKKVQYSENSIDFNSFTKMIGTGRTRLFPIMRDLLWYLLWAF